MKASQAARNFCHTCSDFAFFTGPLAFHSACSALSSAKPALKSVTVDSASARAMSASLASRLVVHTCLRCFRSSCRRVKKRLQAVRKRSHTDCSSRRGAGPMVFHSACNALSASAVAIQSVESASASACSQSATLRARCSTCCACCAARSGSTRSRTACAAARKRVHSCSALSRGAEATAFHCSCSSRILRNATLASASVAERRHLLDELFLHAGIGPALPVVGLAQRGRLGLQQFA